MGASEKHDAAYHGTETAEPEYFGIPGVCYDIDGGWWHEPGSQTSDPDFQRWLFQGGPMPKPNARHCCGIVGVHDQEVSR